MVETSRPTPLTAGTALSHPRWVLGGECLLKEIVQPLPNTDTFQAAQTQTMGVGSTGAASPISEYGEEGAQ